MAQTKRKRRTKHRGNAAGMVEARGRTGRKPTEAELRASAGKGGKPRKVDRLDRPPSWRSAANRAGVAALFFAVAIVLIFDRPIGSAVALAAFMLVIYIPMTYLTDSFVYKRRQKRKAAGLA